MKRFVLILFTVLVFGAANACAAADWQAMQPVGSMPLDYAHEFRVDYYADDLALVTVEDTGRLLLVPEGAEKPENLDEDIAVAAYPIQNLYLAATSAMDFFVRLDALDTIALTSTKADSWTMPEAQAAMERDEIRYVGKYSSPDYERIAETKCPLAIESTMIFHSPETKEQLEALGVSVMVEHSSYETHPMGRVEWIKLYGLMTGHLSEAEAIFAESEARMNAVLNGDVSGRTATFFYIAENGYANIRRPGDYTSRMIEMAGGRYLPSEESDDEGLSTMNMEMEAFFAATGDADVIIYNGTSGVMPHSLKELTDLNPLLAEYKAVRSGDVWCCLPSMFQQTTHIADMLEDFAAVLNGTDQTELNYLYRLN